MVRESSRGRVGTSTKEVTGMTREKATERCLGLMGLITKENGNLESSMVRAR